MTGQGIEVLTGRKESMTSLEIAELVGREHKSVMRSIREMEEGWVKIRGCKFALTSREVQQPNGGIREVPCYELNKIECLYIATKFNDEARAKLVIRWEELETKERTGGFVVPQTFSQALMLAARQQEEIERQQKAIEAKDRKIAEDAPKVVFSDAVVGSKSSCLIGELAKILTQNGYQIGQNRLFEKLRNEGYLGSKGEYYNIPNQKFIEQGLFELKKTAHSENGVMKSSVTPKVTGKGQQYFINKYLKGTTMIRFDEEDN